MTRLIWIVLNDGRSVVAGAGTQTKDTFRNAIEHPEKTLTLTSDDRVEHIPTASVRDFILFDAKSSIPPATSIYRLVHV